jgi:LacI family transcriptional regulator
MASKLADVAQRAGVSVATASRVLSDSSYRVTDELRNRVLAAAEMLHYVPNAHAQALVGSRTRMVGVIVHDVSDPYFSEITRGIQGVASDNGRLVMICNTYRDLDRELAYVRLLHAQRVEAIVLAGSGLDNRDFSQQLIANLERFSAAGGHVALIGRHHVAGDAVVADNAGGARAVGDALLALGHRRIGVLSGPPLLTTTRDRLEAFGDVLAEAGCSLPPTHIVDGDFTRDGGYQAAQTLLRQAPDISAIFALNDPMAIGALAALHERGIAVPEGMSVVGFDDIPQARDTFPALSTVQVPMIAMGVRAMELALDPHTEGFRTELFPTKLVLRASTAAASDERRTTNDHRSDDST